MQVPGQLAPGSAAEGAQTPMADPGTSRPRRRRREQGRGAGRGAPQVLQHLRAPDRVAHVQHRLLMVLVAPIREQQVALHHLHQLVVAGRVLRQKVQPRDLARAGRGREALQPRGRGPLQAPSRRCGARGRAGMLGAAWLQRAAPRASLHMRGAWAMLAWCPGSVLAACALAAQGRRKPPSRPYTHADPVPTAGALHSRIG